MDGGLTIQWPKEKGQKNNPQKTPTTMGAIFVYAFSNYISDMV
jgi:hypothetical protein